MIVAHIQLQLKNTPTPGDVKYIIERWPMISALHYTERIYSLVSD